MASAMMMKFLVIGIVATTMLFGFALAVDHDVGAPGGGWDTLTDLKSWASSQTFTVGDNLVFTYTSNHDVLEVSKDDYGSCSTNNAQNTNRVSPTTISLTDAGTRYFVCGTAGHCDQGMKVEIKTVEAASGPPSTTTSPPSSDSPVANPPPTLAKPAPPAVSTPGTPVHGGEPETTPPSPSSAATVKMTVVSMVGMGFLMMI